MNQKNELKTETPANYSGAMEADTILKNGASLKSQMSRGNKKWLLVLLAAVLTAGYAQAQPTFGARAGVNYTNMLFFPGGFSGTMQPGFQAGVVAENSINGQCIQAGLLIVSQKSKFNEGFLMEFLNETLNLTYLRMPINFLYKKDLSDMKLLLQAGFFPDIAVSGKITGEKRGEKVEEKITLGKGGMSRLGSGVGLGAGLQFDNIQTVLEYNLGFGGNNGVTMLRNGFALNLTYFFNK